MVSNLCVIIAPQRPGRPSAAQLALKRMSRAVLQDSADTGITSAENYTDTFQSAESLAVRRINGCLGSTNMEQTPFTLSETDSYSEPRITIDTGDPFSHFQFDNIDNIGLSTFRPPDLALGLDVHLIGSFEPVSSPSTLPATHNEVKENKSTSSNSIDAQIQDLAQLNLPVLQSSREVERDLATTQLSISSPSFNGIFEATGNFIAIYRQVSEYQLDRSLFNYMFTSHSSYSLLSELDPSSPINCRSNKSSIDTSLQPDSGVLLMMLAFHHRLTSIFETTCSSIYRHLLSTDIHTNVTRSNTEHLKNTPQSDGHRQPNSWTHQSLPFPATTFGPNDTYDWSLPSTAQIVILVRLIRHLANRMNWVLRPFIDYPMKPNTIPSQIPNTLPVGDYSIPSFFQNLDIRPLFSKRTLPEYPGT